MSTTITLTQREIAALNTILKTFWAESRRDWCYENESGWDYLKAVDDDHIVSDLISLKHLNDRIEEKVKGEEKEKEK